MNGRLAHPHAAPRHAFFRRFTTTEVAQLAGVDALHSTLFGPATKKLMERAYQVFGVRALNGWRGFRCPIYAAYPRRTAYQVTSESITCIKAIRMG